MIDIHSSKVVAFRVAVESDGFRFTDVNRAGVEQSGIRAEDQIGKRPEECFPPALAEKALHYYEVCARTNAPVVYEIEFVLPNGYYAWRTTLIPFIDAQTGAVSTLIGFCQDCTQDKIAERAAAAFNEKLTSAIGAIDGGVWSYEFATGHFETSPPLAELLAGPGHTSLSLAEYASHVHAEDLGLHPIFPREDRSTADYRIVTHDGRTRWLQSKRRVIRDATGTPVSVVGLVVDITEQKTAFRALEAEASTDALTSLKNRRAFDRIATRALREARADAETIGLLMIDLDGFKPINDSYGHRAGDEVLRKVARRIARHVRKSDTLARIGGDEFAILLRNASAAIGEDLATRIRRTCLKPLPFDGRSLVVGISMGIALAGPADETIDTLFERADRDLYATKRRQRLLAS